MGTKKPKKNKPNAQVFDVTQDEMDNDNDVVLGTFLITNMSVYVLF